MFKPPKTWRKIAPNTIEAWLVSDDPHDQCLADEALSQLDPEAAQAHLQHILVLEQDTIQQRIRFATILCIVPLVLLFIAYFVTKDFLFYLGAIAGMMIASLGSIPFRQTTTVLQTRVVAWVIAKRDVRFIGVLLKSLSTVPSVSVNNSVREHLPYFMEQITADTKNRVPDEFWKLFTQALESVAKQNPVRYVPIEQAFAIAHIRICGNVRHEPALPALRMIAEKDVATPQAREWKALAAGYVAEWNKQPASRIDTIPYSETSSNPLRLTG